MKVAEYQSFCDYVKNIMKVKKWRIVIIQQVNI